MLLFLRFLLTGFKIRLVGQKSKITNVKEKQGYYFHRLAKCLFHTINKCCHKIGFEQYTNKNKDKYQRKNFFG